MSTNLADLVLRHAEQRSDVAALTVPRAWSDDAITDVESITFGELARRIGRFRRGLADAGYVAGDRFVVMFPVCIDLYAFVLALLAEGMVAVFVDLGMGKKRVLHAVRQSKAVAIVSVDPLLKLWPLVRVLWGRKRYSVDRRRIGVQTLDSLLADEPTDRPTLDRERGASALMTFTSGSTGVPRAADRTHDILIAQHEALLEEFPNIPGEVDMTCFPVVPLHSLCCGISTVMPAVDLREPASVEPGLVLDQIVEHGVTRLSGAPAFLSRIADEVERRGGRGMETISRVGVGGAPTPRDLCRRLVASLPDAELIIIYGSTEAEPMSTTTMAEFAEAQGDGYLVGSKISAAATLALVDLDEPLPTLDHREMEPYKVPRGEPGEVVVRGPHVLREYVDDPEATRTTKLPALDGGVWHRTGDVGYWDRDGRLWLVGRMNDAIPMPAVAPGRPSTLHPFAVEQEVEQIEGVRRCAVVANRDHPHGVCYIEVQPAVDDVDAVTTALADLLQTRGLSHLRVVQTFKIPVDPRHNSKVDRVKLREQLEDDLPPNYRRG